MPVTDVRKDTDARTITITAELAAPVERVWQVYADPRQLERVWGPPSHPATFVEHALEPGARVTYYMTSPEGEKFAGYWDVESVDEPRGFTFVDGFADGHLQPLDSMPTSTCVYRFESVEGGTRAVYTTTFASAEAMAQVLEMGLEEGARSAIGQIDGLLAA